MSAASTSRRSRATKASCTAGGLRVKSSSNWSITTTASAHWPRHRDTMASATSGSAKPSSCRTSPTSPAKSGARARANDRNGVSPGWQATARQPSGVPGDHPGLEQRALADPGGADHRQQPAGGDLAPQIRDLPVPAEEVLGIGLGERRQPRVRAAVLVAFDRTLGESGHLGGGHVNRGHRRDQPVTPLGDGLDVPGAPGVITQRVSELGDAPGQGVVRDELGLPHRIEQLGLAHQLAGANGQADQHVHRLELELDRLAAVGQPVQGRLHQPFSDEKRIPSLTDRLELRRHLGAIVGPTPASCNPAGSRAPAEISESGIG